jgi:hypothetical protein
VKRRNLMEISKARMIWMCRQNATKLCWRTIRSKLRKIKRIRMTNDRTLKPT